MVSSAGLQGEDVVRSNGKSMPGAAECCCALTDWDRAALLYGGAVSNLHGSPHQTAAACTTPTTPGSPEQDDVVIGSSFTAWSAALLRVKS